MSKSLLTLIMISLFTGCENMVMGNQEIFGYLGVSGEFASDDICTKDQFNRLKSELNENQAIENIKKSLQNAEIKNVIFITEFEKSVSCDQLIINEDEKHKDLNCDPASKTGIKTDLKKTMLTKEGSNLKIKVNSQRNDIIFIHQSLHNVTEDEEIVFVKQILKDDYLSFDKFNNLSLTFEVSRDRQEYKTTTRCGETLSAQEITQLIESL